MRIVVLDGYTLNPGDLSWDGLAQLGDLRVYDRTPIELVVERSEGAEVLLTNKSVLDAGAIDELSPTLKYIGVLATGFNVVDILAARDCGVVVTNVPAYGAPAVAQHTFALILELASHVGLNNSSVQEGEWSSNQDWSYSRKAQVELSGKTLGIVGLGKIGEQVARIARGFGMKVIYHNPRPKTDSPYEFHALIDLFGIVDIVTLHCPLTRENQGFVDASLLREMKKTGMLINTSRGLLVNEVDLAQALKNNKLAGAGLDVLSTEPPGEDNPLIGVPNCIVTPHNAWATREARTRLLNLGVENLIHFLEGKQQNVIS